MFSVYSSLPMRIKGCWLIRITRKRRERCRCGSRIFLASSRFISIGRFYCKLLSRQDLYIYIYICIRDTYSIYTYRMRNRRSLGKTKKKSADWCTRCVQRTRSTSCIVRCNNYCATHSSSRKRQINSLYVYRPIFANVRASIELSIPKHYGQHIFDVACVQTRNIRRSIYHLQIYVNYTSSVSLIDQSLIFSLANQKSLKFILRELIRSSGGNGVERINLSVFIR